MNNPNPFVPKGSILEAQSKRRSRLKIAVFCSLAVGVAGLSAMLIQGCKREQPPTDDTTTPTIDTNPPAIVDTNPPAIDTNPPVPPVATNPPAVVSAIAPAGTEYVVVKGDILATIAKKNGVTLKQLEAANPGIVPTKLKVGQKLTLPAPTASAVAPAAAASTDTGEETYTVKSGDTLSKIAKSHGMTVKALQAENNLVTTKIVVGKKLKIPAKAEAAASEPTPAAVAPVVNNLTPPSTTNVQ